MEDRNRYKWIQKNRPAYDVIMFDIDDDYAQVKFKDDPEMPIEEVKLSDGQLVQCTGLKIKDKLLYEKDLVSNGENIFKVYFW